MKQYLLLSHSTVEGVATAEEWDAFFDAARRSGLFRGGSEVGEGEIFGVAPTTKLSEQISGYLRFDSDDREPILALLKLHPVVIHGGTVELCEMPES